MRGFGGKGAGFDHTHNCGSWTGMERGRNWSEGKNCNYLAGEGQAGGSELSQQREGSGMERKMRKMAQK